MISDPRYRYMDFEGQFNQAGYFMMNASQIETAIAVFQLNTQLYPNSVDAWGGLAAACQEAQQTAKAIEYYHKIIALDPDGNNGAHARQMIKQLKDDAGN